MCVDAVPRRRPAIRRAKTTTHPLSRATFPRHLGPQTSGELLSGPTVKQKRRAAASRLPDGNEARDATRD